MAFATHILAPTDFSKASLVGVRHAADLARISSGKLTLIHVFDPTPLAPISTRGLDIADQLGHEQGIERAIHRALTDLRNAELPGVADVTLEVAEAPNAAIAITRYAEQHDCDLIALSTQGRTGLAHMLIGSVAENVVRHAKCPVFVAPSG